MTGSGTPPPSAQREVSSSVSPEEAQSTLTFIDYDGGLKEFLKFTPGTTVKLDDLPDSRKDWQKLLLDYVALIEQTASFREG